MTMCRWIAAVSLVAIVGAGSGGAQRPPSRDTVQRPAPHDTVRVPRAGKARDEPVTRPELLIRTGTSKDEVFLEMLGALPPVSYIMAAAEGTPVHLPTPTRPRMVAPSRRIPFAPFAALAGLGALALLAPRGGGGETPTAVVPEPATVLLLGTGLVLIAAMALRRRRTAKR